MSILLPENIGIEIFNDDRPEMNFRGHVMAGFLNTDTPIVPIDDTNGNPCQMRFDGGVERVEWLYELGANQRRRVTYFDASRHDGWDARNCSPVDAADIPANVCEFLDPNTDFMYSVVTSGNLVMEYFSQLFTQSQINPDRAAVFINGLALAVNRLRRKARGIDPTNLEVSNMRRLISLKDSPLHYREKRSERQTEIRELIQDMDWLKDREHNVKPLNTAASA